jgi:hypothetical protein
LTSGSIAQLQVSPCGFMTDSTDKTPTRLDVCKDRLLQATSSKAFGAILWSFAAAATAYILWRSPLDFAAWRSSLDGTIQIARKAANTIREHPLGSAALSVLQHPLAGIAAIAVLLLVWLKDYRATLAHRNTAPLDEPLAPALRVHLFAHRLGLVVAGMLAIFPGVVLLISDWGFVLLPIVLAVPYFAIRILGWVVAALFA